MSEIVIRALETVEEIAQAEQIQRVAWTMSDLDIIPTHALHAMEHNGAVLLGAFEDDKVIGFVFGVLGTEENPNRLDQVAAARLKMYSVIAGVLPEYQQHDIGYRLKMAQRDFALRIGIRLITWTYDPLESLNARFNIGKLGAVCRRYLPNFHGDMTGINTGLPTDRFETEWWVAQDRVAARTERKWRPLQLDALLAGGALLINEATINEAGLPVAPLNYVSRPGNMMLVEIPANFQSLKRADMPLAQRWRMHTREVFENLFGSGFIVTDFVTHEDERGNPHSYYLLTHQDS
jgi:predicted GNAT superfamily acetyltransferase